MIEQQTAAFDAYCPMEYVPSVFDAIQWLVAEDISVVEPSSNGAHDLDAEYWEGWFDLDVQDSGAIMVGGSYGVGDLTGRVVLLMVPEWTSKGGLIIS